MDVACLVLPDKKVGSMHLACGNCDSMKISCAIDGVGVQERMQGKSKVKAAEASSNPKCSRTCPPKSRRTVKSPPAHVDKLLTSTPPHTPCLSLQMVVEDCGESRCLSVKRQLNLHGDLELTDAEAELNVMNIMPAQLNAEPRAMMQTPECEVQPDIAHAIVPEPTPREILQSIQELGQRFDLLATNDRVDALDARIESVEGRIGQQLVMLEQCINTSDVQWRAMLASVGHLTLSLWDHKDDVAAHRHPISTAGYAPPQHSNIDLPQWLCQTENLNLSAIGRQWTHAWDPSVVVGVQGCVGTSA
ncbi:hypothetical protein C8R48DRAFT_774813 [Suillus tomentosus]|nr:hypothetical protein C8R48DRAFT_774813 [Suillus tomentosus]